MSSFALPTKANPGADNYLTLFVCKLSRGVMYYEKRGARDRHRYGVDGVVTKFVGKKKEEAKA